MLVLQPDALADTGILLHAGAPSGSLWGLASYH